MLQVSPPHHPQHHDHHDHHDTSTLPSSSSVSSSVRKPFFIMDWLEDMMQDKDIDAISEMLHTPRKVCSASSSCPGTPKSSNRKRHCRSLNDMATHQRDHKSSVDSPPAVERKRLDRTLFPAPAVATAAAAVVVTPTKKTTSSSSCCSMTSTSSSPSTISPSSASSSPPTSSPFYRKSIQMGNGWNAKGLQKAKSGLWQDALRCWDNALEIRYQVLGATHVDVANTCNNRGIALGKLGLWQDAVSSLQQALEIRQRQLGPHHAQVAATLHNLANVHHHAGDLQGAILLLSNCQRIYRQTIITTTTHEQQPQSQQQSLPQQQDSILSTQQLARACVAMGHVYWEAGQIADATQAYLEALTIYKHQLTTPEQDHHVQEIRHDLQQLEHLQSQQSQSSQASHESCTFQRTTTTAALASPQTA